jgi:hypothetical protein
MDLRADLDNEEKRKFLPHRNSNSDPSVAQPVASRYTDCAIPAPRDLRKRIKYIPKRKNQYLYFICCLLDLLYGPEDRDSAFLRNVGTFLIQFTASHP